MGVDSSSVQVSQRIVDGGEDESFCAGNTKLFDSNKLLDEVDSEPKVIVSAGNSLVNIGDSRLEIVHNGDLDVEESREDKPEETLYKVAVHASDNGNLHNHNIDLEVQVTSEKSVKRRKSRQVDGQQYDKYFLLKEETAGYSVSDLVWGKVRSHPWWPGQIFDPKDASEMAKKHQKKDHLLVAYFGDKTFGWCDDSKLKPFEPYFSQMEKQSSVDVFVDAVDEALEEISQRVELGMTCLCVPLDACSRTKEQKVENAGLREGTCRLAVERTQIAGLFQPDKLIDYLQSRAVFPTSSVDRLGLVTAKSQLKAFYRTKGYPELATFVVEAELTDNDWEISPGDIKDGTAVVSSTPVSSSGKRRSRGRKKLASRCEDIVEDGKKEKSLSELMDEKEGSKSKPGKKNSGKMPSSPVARKRKKVADIYSNSRMVSASSGRKRKVTNGASRDPGKRKRKRLNALGDLDDKQTPSRYLKVGEGIRRVAKRLSVSPSMFENYAKTDDTEITSEDDRLIAFLETRRRKKVIGKNFPPLSEFLSQLCLAATVPKKKFSFLSAIISFFSDFRASITSGMSYTESFQEKHEEEKGGKGGRKRSTNTQSSLPDVPSQDFVPDSYWSDIVFQSSPEKETKSSSPKRKKKSQQRGRKKRKHNSRKQSPSFRSGSQLDTAEQSLYDSEGPDAKDAPQHTSVTGDVKEEGTPAGLILSFTESHAVPSETDLIKTFSPYGPLHESEAVVSRETNQAKVVFKYRSDAELAFSAAGKDSIYESALVSYRLEYYKSTLSMTPLNNDSVQGIDLDAPAGENTAVA